MHQHIIPELEQQRLLLLDQRLLPQQEEYFTCHTVNEIIYAIQEMVVRGAPAIGVTAAWGCWLAALELQHEGIGLSPHWEKLLHDALDRIEATRPTAINLRWAVQQMRDFWQDNAPLALDELIQIWEKAAQLIQIEDIAINRKIGEYGAELLEDGDTVMTHCNAGALATAGFGTALGVIYAAIEAGKKIHVITNETRPLLQGARLSAYELNKAGIKVTVACDNACALLMQKGLVQKVITGADRIAANGDTANKIGTYGVALLAKNFKIPFYVAAPKSTFDFTCTKGANIPIEERSREEVAGFGGLQTVPAQVPVFNYAFDVTPSRLINGIITEYGIYTAPYTKNLKQLKSRTDW